jgi:hypothetical protein
MNKACMKLHLVSRQTGYRLNDQVQYQRFPQLLIILFCLRAKINRPFPLQSGEADLEDIIRVLLSRILGISDFSSMPTGQDFYYGSPVLFDSTSPIVLSLLSDSLMTVRLTPISWASSVSFGIASPV